LPSIGKEFKLHKATVSASILLIIKLLYIL